MAVWQKSAVYWMRSDAVPLGQDDEGNAVFVGRLTVGDGLTLGKVIPQKKGIFVPFNDVEIKMKDFEVLVEDSTPPFRSVSWVRVTEGQIPEKAIMAGTFRRGGKYYIGRGLFQGVITPGKVHSGDGLIYFGYGDKQNTSKEYEVLVET